MLKEKYGKDFWVVSIGQARENLVRFACATFDKHYTAARGSGAVLGVKRLKAIVIHGTKRVTAANENEFRRLAMEDNRFFKEDKSQREIAEYGTHLGMIRW